MVAVGFDRDRRRDRVRLSRRDGAARGLHRQAPGALPDHGRAGTRRHGHRLPRARSRSSAATSPSRSCTASSPAGSISRRGSAGRRAPSPPSATPASSSVFDFASPAGEEPGYIVSELIEGPGLRAVLEARGGRLRPEVAALDRRPRGRGAGRHARRGIVHRDVEARQRAHRLRGRPRARGAHGLRRRARQQRGHDDGDGRGRRLARVHVARAGAQRGRGRAQRRLLAGGDAVPALHGTPAVLGEGPLR